MHNTIFDDVFRTMLEKMSYLAVPLINEVFQASYPDDVELIQLRNEHQKENGESITDSCLKIGKKMYHIECQSTDDTTMAVRMIEYDFLIAFEHAQKQGRRYRMEFPKSCVLYLRSGRDTPDFLEVEVVFPDGKLQLYQIPSIKMVNYTKNMIFEKNLLMLLPFYVMRYEKDAHLLSENPEMLQDLLSEYEEICKHLENELAGKGRSDLYTDLIGLIVRISDYIFKDEDVVRKGMGDIMGGKVLELESERLRAEGKAIGEAIGEARGEAIGEARGEAIGEARGEARLSTLINKLILDGRSGEIQTVVSDSARRQKLYKEYGI